MIYIVGEKRTGIVKIGRAANPFSRLSSLQTGSPVKLEVQAVLPGGHEHEHWLHTHFASERKQGEWFDFGDRDAVVCVIEAWLTIADQSTEQLRVAALPKGKGPRWHTPLDRNGEPMIFTGREGEYDWWAPKEIFEP